MHAPEVKSYMVPMLIGQPYVLICVAPTRRDDNAFRVDNFGIGIILRSEDVNYSPGIYVYGYCRKLYI